MTDPLDYIDEDNQQMAATGLSVVSMRASLLNYDNMLSGDSYSLIRDVYLQKRAYEVNDGAVDDEFDDLEDY
jgi:phospholipid-binding lipoprotein MlaA